MGITLLSAEFIIQEHCYRALPSTIHLLGRQTVCFDYETARSLMYRHGITPANAPMQADESTRTAITGSRSYISDTTFFGMLGVNLVHAIDHSDYEGADILVDLNRPIAPEYEGIADFIFGGSVLDNVFDPACYMRNITRMLRPGGRLIDVNACSFGNIPTCLYLLLGTSTTASSIGLLAAHYMCLKEAPRFPKTCVTSTHLTWIRRPIRCPI